jgi:Zn-finger nucleic acid-binding protein
MRGKDLHGIEIDECPDCKGTWFEQDELRKTKDIQAADLNWLDFDLWKHPERFHAADKPLACPRCAVNMVTIEYDRTGVEIDYCASCGGVWLDAHEMEQIIRALFEELETKNLSDYIAASLEEAREIVTGAEGFISEWRDFLTVVRLIQYRILTDHPRMHKILADLQSSSPATS